MAKNKISQSTQKRSNMFLLMYNEHGNPFQAYKMQQKKCIDYRIRKYFLYQSIQIKSTVFGGKNLFVLGRK